MNRVAAQMHMIATLSQLQNVDKVTIWNIMYLVEFDGPDYNERSIDLLYPSRGHTVYHDEAS